MIFYFLVFDNEQNILSKEHLSRGWGRVDDPLVELSFPYNHLLIFFS